MAKRGSSAVRVVSRAAIVAGVIAAAGAVAVAALSIVVARRVVTPSKKRLEDIRILASTDATVTLSSTADTRLPGRYSLWFSHGTGHAKLGGILSSTASTVTRTLGSVDYGDLAVAERGYFAGWVYLSPRELGVPFDDVVIDTPLGPAPAWLIPAADSTDRWVIGVHGRGVRRAECLRAVEVVRRCGYNSLLVSYRNDGDAPSSADGRYGLGDTEWEDIDAAISYAIDHGAAEIVLMGWSMGGATVLQTATRSRHASVIRGLILESPVVDWVTTLNFQAESLGIPRPLSLAAKELISQSWSGRLTGQDAPIDLGRLDFVRRSDELSVPILLLHSADDGFVPPDASRALAQARPDIVTYDEFTIARHTKLWNYDAERWNADIGTWLSRL